MRRTIHALPATAVLAAAALLLAACSSGESVDTGGGSGGGSGSGVLNAAITGEPDQLDPYNSTNYNTFQVLENVYDTLVEPDDKLEMKPALAESWTTADDQLSWTFKLRPGVKFSNGDAFDADDVVYSFDRIIDGKLNPSYRLATVKDVKKVDATTVRFDLTQPTPALLVAIGGYKALAIVDEKNVKDGGIKDKPVGTGPFTLESWQRGQSISLKANPNYWGGAPKLKGVTFTFVSEPTTALANLQGGQVQWTDNIPPAQVENLTSGDDPVVKSVPSQDYFYFALNEKKKPFSDPRVRQAFAWAIDRESVAEAAKFGAATANQTAIPKTSPWYDGYAPYRQDVNKAKSLLQQAGVSNLQVDYMVTSAYPETVTAAQVLKDQLSKVGITLNIRTEDINTWLADEGAGKYDAFALSWVGNIDPDEFYYSQHYSKGANNYQKFDNADVDTYLDKARTEPDEAKRKSLYADATKIIVDQASYIYLYNSNAVQGWSKDLTGYTVRPDKAIRFPTASLGS